MWSIIAGLLSSNNSNAESELEAQRKRQQSVTDNILKNRSSAANLKNQTTSANYGKFNIDELVNGVFTSGNARNQVMNWSQYA